MNGLAGLVFTLFVAFAVFVGVSIYIYYGRLYMRSRVMGAEVEFSRMFRMTTSGVSAFRVVTAYLNARQSGFDVSLERFEDLARAGGDPRQVAQRLETARRNGEAVDIDALFALQR